MVSTPRCSHCNKRTTNSACLCIPQCQWSQNWLLCSLHWPGDDLWQPDSSQHITATAGYVTKHTGSDSPRQNVKQIVYGAFGVMDELSYTLLRFPPQFWSAALAHPFHLEKRQWHSALYDTPFEAGNDIQFDLSHLRAFDLLWTAKMLGHSPAKLDKHVCDGIFLGYEGFLSKDVVYLDVHSRHLKVGGNIHFDEAHYTLIPWLKVPIWPWCSYISTSWL